MNKWIYTIFGISLVIFSFVLFSWFFTDFKYGIQHITNPTYFARVFVPWVALYLGIFYGYYGIKSENINKNSNISLLVLFYSLLISLILMLSIPYSIPGPISTFWVIIDDIWRTLLPLGIIISIVFSIIAIFDKKNK